MRRGTMLLCDGGSSYTKLYDTDTKLLEIVPTKDLIRNKSRFYDLATGHSSRLVCSHYVNELISLAEGALELIPEDNFTILDIGARDAKYILFRNREALTMDWNSSCGGNMGFTIEMLGNYYDIDYDQLLPIDKSIPVTCGLLGIEKVFDEINQGGNPEKSVSKFIHGFVKNIYLFIQKPKHLYLSGGFTLNQCFVNTLKQYCNVTLLGRDVLLKGLIKIAREDGLVNTSHSSFIDNKVQ